MIRSIILGLGAGLLVLVAAGGWSAPGALADNGPHVKGHGMTADSCAGCHRAHTAQGAGLLKQEQPGLCYSCHGTGGIGASTNVQDGQMTTGEALKGGGFANAKIDTDDPSVKSGTIPAHIGVGLSAPTTSNHSADNSAVTAWGMGGVGTSFNLRCGSCHDPHGNTQYRILRTMPQGNGAHGFTGPSVAIADEASKTYATSDYFDVSYLKGASTSFGISAWCSLCHERYLAPSGSGDTDSGDATFRYRHAANDDAAGGGTGHSPLCITCHVAHGTNATMGTQSAGVPFPDTTTKAGDASSRLLKMNNRGICQKCHNK